MAVPRWSGDYFRWQLRMDHPQYRRHLIAAYEGSRLVGAILHFPVQFSLSGELMNASQQSWLSVSPDFRRQGVGNAMIERSIAVHREWRCRIKLGFTYYGGRASLGPKFWLRSQMENSKHICNAGFWVRVLDPVRAADWNVNRFEGWMTRLSAPLFPTLRQRSSSKHVIRVAEHRDIPRCLLLVDQATRHCDLRLVWDANSLGRQLGLNGYSHALVLEEQGEVRGFITFHVLPMLGRTEARVGVIDLVAVSELSRTDRNELIDSALMALKQLGAIVALKLRLGDYPRGLFLRRGWFLRPADSHVIVRWIRDPQPILPLRRIHILWR